MYLWEALTEQLFLWSNAQSEVVWAAGSDAAATDSSSLVTPASRVLHVRFASSGEEEQM